MVKESEARALPTRVGTKTEHRFHCGEDRSDVSRSSMNHHYKMKNGLLECAEGEVSKLSPQQKTIGVSKVLTRSEFPAEHSKLRGCGRFSVFENSDSIGAKRLPKNYGRLKPSRFDDDALVGSYVIIVRKKSTNSQH